MQIASMIFALRSAKLETPGATYPAGLAAEITAQVGPYCIVPRGVYVPGAEEVFLDEVHRSLELRRSLTSYLLKHHRCDVHVFVLYETDLVQHKMWQFMDESHPRHNTNEDRWANAIRDVYVHADDIVGELMQKLETGDTLVVMSDHGAGPLYGTLHLNKWLHKQGYLVLKRGWRQWWPGAIGRWKVVQLCARISRQLRVNQRFNLGHNQRRALASGFLRAGDIDWPATRAYNMGFQGAIYTVGESHAETTRELTDLLVGIREPDSSCTIVDSVYVAGELYKGPFLNRAPNIILTLRNEAYSTSQKVFAPSLVSLGADTGTHQRQGLLGLIGKGSQVVPNRPTFYMQEMAQLLLQIAEIQ